MRQVDRSQQALAVNLPAPVTGWNARDSLAAMPPTDAIQLDNWFPRPDRVIIRGGSIQWATGLGGSVDTVAEWSGPSSSKLLAAANGSVFDASAQGAVGAALASGFSSNQWQTAMMTTPGGAFLLWFNGADAPQKYDGTTWSAMSITGTSPALTNTNLIQATVYRSRVFMVEKNSMRVWYLPVNAIGGAANALELGQFCKMGGAIQAVGTWTVDGGTGGSDDLLVVVTTQGEILLYGGVDPSSATTWSLVGIFRCAKPIGRRCILKFGADVILLLQDGVYEASRILRQGIEQPVLALSDKIRGAFADASAAYQTVFGWDLLYYPNGQRLMVNVPQDSVGTAYAQFTMNSISQAWCRFLAMNARSWALLSGVPFFGAAGGIVWKADTTNTDNAVAITAPAKQAFSNLGVAGRTKHVVAVQPMFSGMGQPAVSVAVDADYANGQFPSPSTLLGGTGSPWNTSPWNISPWGQGDAIFTPWLTLGTLGVMLAPKVSTQSKSSLSWYQTNIVAEAGGILGGSR